MGELMNLNRVDALTNSGKQYEGNAEQNRPRDRVFGFAWASAHWTGLSSSLTRRTLRAMG